MLEIISKEFNVKYDYVKNLITLTEMVPQSPSLQGIEKSSQEG